MYLKDKEAISKQGFFQNYDNFTISVILLQAFGGMIIVAVVNYTDNIIKCFANACSILTSALASYFLLNDFKPTSLFVCGAVLVVTSVFLYSTKKNESLPSHKRPLTLLAKLYLYCRGPTRTTYRDKFRAYHHADYKSGIYDA